MKGSVSNRDKKLLILLGVILIVFLIYYFVLSPQYDRNTALKEQFENSRQEYIRVSQILEQVGDLEREEIKQKSLLTEKYKSFFYEINEERILHRLDTLFANATFPVTEYVQSEPIAAGISSVQSDYQPLKYPLLDLARKSNAALAEESKDTIESEQQESSADQSVDAVPAIEITLGFTGASYGAIMSFLDALETMDRSAIISNIQIEREEATQSLKGEILLTVYSLPKVDENEKNDLIFQPITGKGKANPF